MEVRVTVQLGGVTQLDLKVEVEQVKAEQLEAAVQQAIADVLDQGGTA